MWTVKTIKAKSNNYSVILKLNYQSLVRTQYQQINIENFGLGFGLGANRANFFGLKIYSV